jgi:hypothetical protein
MFQNLKPVLLLLNMRRSILMIDMNVLVQLNLLINQMKEKKVHYNVITLLIPENSEHGKIRLLRSFMQQMEIYFIMIINIHFNQMLMYMDQQILHILLYHQINRIKILYVIQLIMFHLKYPQMIVMIPMYVRCLLFLLKLFFFSIRMKMKKIPVNK